MAQVGLRDCWSVWNAHHLKIKTEYPGDFVGGRAIRIFRKQIKDGWKDLSIQHPNNHGAVKRQFHAAAKRVKQLTDGVKLAKDIMNDHVNQNWDLNLVDAPEPIENVMLAQHELLQGIQGLVRVERSIIRQPANLIRQYDERRVRALKFEIQAFAQQVSRERLAYEGRGPDLPMRRLNRTAYQQRPQGRNVTPRRGGNMYHFHLETSSQTSAGLWVLSDANNVIRDRVVVKDMWFIGDVHKWTSPLHWFGDPLDPAAKQPQEALIQEKLVHETILGIRSWHIHAQKLMCRICLEWCPYGDAVDMIINHDNHWRQNIGGGRRKVDYMIPEPVVWHAFDTLIRAGLVMQQGDVDGPADNWIGGPVVHLDLKPENLFVGDYPDQDAEDPENFALYPAFKLADFGHSIDNRRNPLDHRFYRRRGTPDYQAPEQTEDRFYRGTPPNEPLNTKTNVWGAGIIVMALMNLNTDAGQLTGAAADNNSRRPDQIPAFTADAMRKYSAPLRNMVISCLQFRQSDRPTFHTLQTQLGNVTGLGMQGPGSRDYTEGARRATRNNTPPNYRPLMHLRANAYALGLAAPPVNTAI